MRRATPRDSARPEEMRGWERESLRPDFGVRRHSRLFGRARNGTLTSDGSTLSPTRGCFTCAETKSGTHRAIFVASCLSGQRHRAPRGRARTVESPPAGITPWVLLIQPPGPVRSRKYLAAGVGAVSTRLGQRAGGTLPAQRVVRGVRAGRSAGIDFTNLPPSPRAIRARGLCRRKRWRLPRALDRQGFTASYRGGREIGWPCPAERTPKRTGGNMWH